MPEYFSEKHGTFAQVERSSDQLPLHLRIVKVWTHSRHEGGQIAFLPNKQGRFDYKFFGDKELAKEAFDFNRDFVASTFVPYARLQVAKKQEAVERAKDDLREATAVLDKLVRDALTTENN